MRKITEIQVYHFPDDMPDEECTYRIVGKIPHVRDKLDSMTITAKDVQIHPIVEQ